MHENINNTLWYRSVLNHAVHQVKTSVVLLVFQCVERLDLAGMDFIWRIAMETPDEEIANEAILLIITYSYTNLNPKMKKVFVCLKGYC